MMKIETMIDFPTREEIAALAVGDLALNAWGRMAVVDEITHRGEDRNGFLFVQYMTRNPTPGGTSMSRKESRVTRTVAISSTYTSREIDDIEEGLLQARGVVGRPIGSPFGSKALSLTALR